MAIQTFANATISNASIRIIAILHLNDRGPSHQQFELDYSNDRELAWIQPDKWLASIIDRLIMRQHTFRDIDLRIVQVGKTVTTKMYSCSRVSCRRIRERREGRGRVLPQQSDGDTRSMFRSSRANPQIGTVQSSTLRNHVVTVQRGSSRGILRIIYKAAL
jgi:hypothetical protein